MEKIAAGIRLDYEKGLYSSEDAERLLQDHYLTDKTGTIWAIGFRSGAWHFYKDRRVDEVPDGAGPRLAARPG